MFLVLAICGAARLWWGISGADGGLSHISYTIWKMGVLQGEA